MDRPNLIVAARSGHDPDAVLKEVDGSFGKIRILSSTRPTSASYDELHALVARVLYKNSKRTASGNSNS